MAMQLNCFKSNSYIIVCYGEPSLHSIGAVTFFDASRVCTDWLCVPIPPITTITMSLGLSAISLLEVKFVKFLLHRVCLNVLEIRAGLWG